MKYNRLSCGGAIRVPLLRAAGARHSFARLTKATNIQE
jgi:hypothetical protein